MQSDALGAAAKLKARAEFQKLQLILTFVIASLAQNIKSAARTASDWWNVLTVQRDRTVSLWVFDDFSKYLQADR